MIIGFGDPPQSGGPSGQGRGTWRWPDFVGIGVAKAGTSWLYENMSRHPSIWMPQFKEMQYFNEFYIADHKLWTREHRRRQVGRAILEQVQGKAADQLDFEVLKNLMKMVGDPPNDQWYREIFGRAPSDKLCGEITPEYGALPDAGIEHLLRFNPHIQAILLLRDPIERTWSDIRMALQQPDAISVTVEEMWSSWGVRDFDDYRELLLRWRRHREPGQLMVEFLDHIAAEPFKVLQRVCEFLAVPFERSFFPRASERIHVGSTADLPATLYQTMRQHYEVQIRDLATEFPDPCSRWVARHYGPEAAAVGPT